MRLQTLLEGHPVNLDDLDEPDVEFVQHAIDERHLIVHVFGKPLWEWLKRLVLEKLTDKGEVLEVYYSFDTNALYAKADAYDKKQNDFSTNHYELDKDQKWSMIYKMDFRYDKSTCVNLTSVSRKP